MDVNRQGISNITVETRRDGTTVGKWIEGLVHSQFVFNNSWHVVNCELCMFMCVCVCVYVCMCACMWVYSLRICSLDDLPIILHHYTYTSVASELFAKYPCRLHLTRPKGGGNSADHIDEDEGQHKPSVPKALTCYVLGYGGGLISGDGIEMNIHVKENAKLVITSQSTSKAFKAIPGRDATVVKTRARVARGGLLFLVPQPMQCFGQSVLSQETEVLLDYCGVGSGDDNDTDTNLNAVSKGNGCGPSLLLVDWYTGGRENLDGGMWQLSSYHTKTSVSYRNKQGNEVENDDYDDFRHDDDCGRKCVFHDATRLSGGEDLKRHMRGFNIVAMVVLLGPKVEQVASEFMKKYSSRRIYDDDGNGENFESNASKTMDFNKGDGLNRMHEGLLVSCGRFTTCAEGNHQSGVVLRLAASTLEVAGKFFCYNKCLSALVCVPSGILSHVNKMKMCMEQFPNL